MTALDNAPAPRPSRPSRLTAPVAVAPVAAATAPAAAPAKRAAAPAPAKHAAAANSAQQMWDTKGPQRGTLYPTNASGSRRTAVIGERARAIAPGFALALAVAAVATVVGEYVPLVGSAVPGAVIGAVVALTLKPGARLTPGLKYHGVGAPAGSRGPSQRAIRAESVRRAGQRGSMVRSLLGFSSPPPRSNPRPRRKGRQPR